MYDSSNSGADRIGTPDSWEFQREILTTFNIYNPTVPSSDVITDEPEQIDESNDSFFSMTLETIKYFIGEFTKLFEAYSGIE